MYIIACFQVYRIPASTAVSSVSNGGALLRLRSRASLQVVKVRSRKLIRDALQIVLSYPHHWFLASFGFVLSIGASPRRGLLWHAEQPLGLAAAAAAFGFSDGPGAGSYGGSTDDKASHHAVRHRHHHKDSRPCQS